MIFERFAENPLIQPADVKPSRPDFEVVCAFNPAATLFNDEILLLLRVAERPIQEPGWVSTPVLDLETMEIRVERFRLGDQKLTYSDPRYFFHDGRFYLTSISHLRIARSRDGRQFDIDSAPCLAPATPDEQFGIEDPRITRIDDTYWINATAVSEHGIPTALYSTRDFKTFTRHGIIFAPDNRNVTILPEKVNGAWFCLHRPLTKFTQSSIWTAQSNDLIHWGRYRFLMGPRRGKWDDDHIGGGAVPIKTERGWLAITHGASATGRYCLGAILLDRENPARLIHRRDKPVLEPEAPYEKTGFVNEIVFTCGMIERDGKLLLYYGAGDTAVAGAETKVETLLAHL